MSAKRTAPTSWTHHINDIVIVVYIMGAYIAYEVFFNKDTTIVCQ